MGEYITSIMKTTEYCNLDCDYCYVRESKEKVMDMDSVERLLDLYSESDVEKSKFIWHGGEPLLADIDFFQEVVDLQEDYEVECKNGVQTNGVLLDEEFARFFKDEGFSVSVCLNGPKEIHNSHRTYPDGSGSFEETVEAIELLREDDMKYGIIGVLSEESIGKEREIYETVKEYSDGSARLNPMHPINEERDGKDVGLSSEEFASVMKNLYDEWVSDDERFKLTSLERYISGLTEGFSIGCGSSGRCLSPRYISMDTEGNLYPCARVLDIEEVEIGNVKDFDSMEPIFNTLDGFSKKKAEKIEEECGDEDCYDSCHGGCSMNAYYSNGTVFSKTSFCEGVKELLEYIEEDIENKLDL